MMFPRFSLFVTKTYKRSLRLLGSWLASTYLKQFLIWIKRHQKLTAWGASIVMGVQMHFIRRHDGQTREDNQQLTNKVEFLTARTVSQNTNMDDLGIPYWRKLKVGDRFRIIGLNLPYEQQYGILEINALGRSNFELVPEEAAREYYKVDSAVVADWKPSFAIEPFIFPDGKRVKLFVYKWPQIERRDTIVGGIAIPLESVIKVIDERGTLEVIEIIQDSANQIKDTINIK